MATKYRINLQVFQACKRNIGNLYISSRFVIPATKPWLPEFHNFKLGKYAKKIREGLRKGDYEESDVKTLLELGFVANVEADKEQRLLKAFQHYIHKYGHPLTTENCIVPKSSDWPSECWGFDLGAVLFDMRNYNFHRGIRKEVVGLGFDLSPDYPYEAVHTALSVFKNLYGHVDVPYGFVINPDDASFPPETWGMRLGVTAKSIVKSENMAERREEWLALGLVFDPVVADKVSFDLIYSAMETYKQIHGDLSVPLNYVVRPGNPAFGEEAWGLKLGAFVHSIVHHGAFSKHHKRLKRLGFRYQISIE